YVLYADMLGALSGQLDANVAARAADALIAILGDGYLIGTMRSEFVDHFGIAEALAKVAERLDAPGSLRVAQALIPVLQKVEKFGNVETLRKALVCTCRRLDADGSKRVAEAIAVAVQDPETPVMSRTLLANGFAAVADKLEPDKAAPLTSAIADVLVENLADAQPILTRRQLGQALESVGGRLDTKSATRAAGTLTAALRDPQTPVGLLKLF